MTLIKNDVRLYLGRTIVIGILAVTTVGIYGRRETGSTPNTTKKRGGFIAQDLDEQCSGWRL